MKKWKNVTEFFSEEARNSNHTYLEIDEVYDDAIEVSAFSSQEKPYEIYFSFGILHGIIYVDAKDEASKREEIKKDFEMEYQSHKKPSDEFIKKFCNKYDVSLPDDTFFNLDDDFFG